MRVIQATWYDDFNTPFLTELYESHLNEDEILDFYADQKLIYGRKIIADYANTRVFSDGTRVILQLYEVKKEIESDEVFDPEDALDVEPEILGIGA